MDSKEIDDAIMRKEIDLEQMNDSYLRIRKMLGAYDTAARGRDRFAVTEAKLHDILEQNRRYRAAITIINASINSLL